VRKSINVTQTILVLRILEAGVLNVKHPNHFPKIIEKARRFFRTPHFLNSSKASFSKSASQSASVLKLLVLKLPNRFLASWPTLWPS